MVEIFDQYADSYERHIAQAMGLLGTRHETFLRIKADLLLHLVRRAGHDPAQLSLLDVGCGTGAMARQLVNRVKRLHGVDISSQIIDVARSRVPDATFEHYHPPRLPCEDGSFDMAEATCVMHHVPPVDWPTFMAEMVRAVKPGGFVFVFEHNPLNPMTQLVVKRCEFDRDAVLLRSGQVAKLMHDAGLRVTTTRFCSWLPSASRAAQRFEALLGGLPFGAQYVVVGRREPMT